jgi:hypothetical protein
MVLCSAEPESCDRHSAERAEGMLARFPMDKRKLAPSPELARLPRALLPGRKWRPRAREPVPIELRPVSSFEWKSSPYRVTWGSNPNIEYTGLDYLAAYWLHREVKQRLGGY